MFGFISRYIKSCKLSAAWRRGYNKESCAYEVGGDLYNEWVAGFDARGKHDKREMDELYELVCGFRDMSRDQFSKLVAPLGGRLRNLKMILEYAKQAPCEHQVGAPFFIDFYDTEISIMRTLGYEVNRVQYGFGAYTRICLNIKRIKK